MKNLWRSRLTAGPRILLAATSLFGLSSTACVTDKDCSLNGICGNNGVCACDAGWAADDCGVLDLRPAKSDSGYNRTGEGVSSWGSMIIRDPLDSDLHHLYAAEFSQGCGLDYWAPYSRIIRAESRSGPSGPYKFADEIEGTFSHNPTVVYSPADHKWLMYYIGCKQEVNDTCTSQQFTCGPGNKNNGESGISLKTSTDLRIWQDEGQAMKGEDSDAWDADVTNPSAIPLYSSGCFEVPEDKTPAILLVYRGCPYNCYGAEQINVAMSETGYKGPYKKLQADPIFENENEDAFVWRDKRGNYHMLMHSLEPDGGFGDGPKVGRHAYARNYTGPWTFNDKTLAFNTTVEYEDGRKIDFFRRERPQLFFSKDGQKTPLLLTTGVQPRHNPMSYTAIVPVGDAGVKAQG